MVITKNHRMSIAEQVLHQSAHLFALTNQLTAALFMLKAT
jgi:hypothetical protein